MSTISPLSQGISAAPDSRYGRRPLKTVYISSLADLDITGGVAQLEDNTRHEIINDINFGTTRIQWGVNSYLSSSQAGLYTLTYTGTGDFITVTSASGQIDNIRLDAQSGRVINFNDATGFNGFTINGLISVLPNYFAQFTGTRSGSNATGVRISSCTIIGIQTNGADFFGDFDGLLWEVTQSSISAGCLIDLGTALFSNLQIEDHFCDLAAGTCFLSGQPASANLNPDTIAFIKRVSSRGLGGVLSGITGDEVDFDCWHNDAIADSGYDAWATMTGNLTETVLTEDNPTKISGTFTVRTQRRLEIDTTAKCTLNADRPYNDKCIAVITAAPVQGTNIELALSIHKNGAATPVPGTEVIQRVDSTDPKQFIIPFVAEFTSSGDYFEIYIENRDSSANVLVTEASIRY